jgi:hypothetical protein
MIIIDRARSIHALTPNSEHHRHHTNTPDVMNYYLPPYRAAVAAGVRTFMESYQEISGVPIVSSREYLKVGSSIHSVDESSLSIGGGETVGTVVANWRLALRLS